VSAQGLVGTTLLVTDVEGIKTDKQFVNTLEDKICCHGFMHKLKLATRLRTFSAHLIYSTGAVNFIISIKILVNNAFKI
jgi:hypothetical protein